MIVIGPAIARAGFLEFQWSAPTPDADTERTSLTDLWGYRVLWSTWAEPALSIRGPPGKSLEHPSFQDMFPKEVPAL